MRKAFMIGLAVLLLGLPLGAWAADIPAKVFENGSNSGPVAISGAKMEVFGGKDLNVLLSSGVSGADGSSVLKNIPLGKEVAVKLTKAGYVTQYNIQSYSEADVVDGIILWTGSEANVNGLYGSLGEAFDATKGQIYLEVNDELTGEGIEGIQWTVSSGKIFDLGQGEYLIANAAGSVLRVGIGKPGYAYDIESSSLLLYPGAMTQSYINVQSLGEASANAQPNQSLVSSISGLIKRLSDAVGLSAVIVSFRDKKTGQSLGQTVTKQDGTYIQSGLPVKAKVIVTPSLAGWTFKPVSKKVTVKAKGSKANFKAKTP